MREVRIGPLQQHELGDANRIFNVAFGTFLGAPDPASFFGDRSFLLPRWEIGATILAARIDDRLIGSNVVTRWGSFGFFGPLTILPEFWDQGVAQRLLEKTVELFDAWGVHQSGLYTFATSAKHVNLYQKFGYWPRYLTAIMTKTPQQSDNAPLLLSSLPQKDRDKAIKNCRQLASAVYDGLDPTGEMKAAETILMREGEAVDAFAICRTGADTEGGSKLCYIKFGAARNATAFDSLLNACECFAASRGLTVEAGVNLAREDAYRRLRARGFRTLAQGIAMQRPHEPGFNAPGVYVIDDWR